MPKATKLHSKGKPNSIQKVCKVDKDDSVNNDPEESLRQFQLELCWCIQQLEKSLNEKKGNEKQLQQTWKVLTVLKNNNQPIIRKRQLMRTHFGDYRAQMAAEEKKLAKMASKIKISVTPVQAKATFLRKSAFLTTGDNSFRFNFNLSPEQVEDIKSTDNKSENNNSNNAENTEESSNTDKLNKEMTTNKNKTFKFIFSSSEFKFNFNNDI